MSEPMKKDEFMLFIDTLDDQQKRHFRETIEILVQCYGSKATLQSLLVYRPIESIAAHVISANCNDMDGADMLTIAADYFQYVATRDAPPKEKFN
jgi:hypothetical protein